MTNSRTATVQNRIDLMTVTDEMMKQQKNGENAFLSSFFHPLFLSSFRFSFFVLFSSPLLPLVSSVCLQVDRQEFIVR
jgi:hypothetical protein